MIKKEMVVRFRLVVIALNCLLATLSLINLYTIASGAVKVEIPEEDDFAWTIDTRSNEATFLTNFTVTNKGVYDIEDLDIHAKVRTEKDTMLIDYSQEDLIIPRGNVKKFDIVAVLPFERIDPDEWRSLMINDSVFYLDVDISAKYLWGLGTFVVDDTLEYPWDAPINKIGNKTDERVEEIIRHLVMENADMFGLLDMMLDEEEDDGLLGRFDWADAFLRIESWPQGDNTSKLIARVTLEVLNGRRTVLFEIEMMVKMVGEEYEITMEDFRFDFT
ncbi:MAG: hypothetical protein JSW00_12020 [Thermoplasmata archaeon]|nr:MAG: hypothetical protein JSW00_12020 [Thermoplasmata archaeon]